MTARDILLWSWGIGGSAAVVAGVAVLAHDQEASPAPQVPGGRLSSAVASLLDPEDRYGRPVTCSDTERIVVGATTDCVLGERATFRPVASVRVRWADAEGHFTVRVSIRT